MIPMNRIFTIVDEDAPPVSLRAIAEEDLEDLRLWKNANREAFFFKGEISPEGQREWFRGYLGRPGDFMFIAESEGRKCGCMGFRILSDAADCYNIIGLPACRGLGILGRAMRLMCSYIQLEHGAPVGCLVLKGNPAVGWYEKRGYRIAEARAEHYRLELDPARFSPCPYRKIERAAP